MSDNRGNSKILIIGILSIVVGLVALGVILKTVIFADDSKEPSSMLTEVAGAEKDKDSDNNGITEEMKKTLESESFYSGITIDGVDISGKSKDEVKALFAPNEADADTEKVNVSFKLDDETTVELNGDDVQFNDNLDEIIDEAYNLGRSTDKTGDDGLKERYSEIEELLKNPKDFKREKSVDTDSLSEAVHKALDKYNKEPVEAEVTGFDTETLTFIITESENGLEVNIDKVIEDLTKAFETGDFSFMW